ncbi:hypothetical protein V1498_06720 [Peribacillus sp. SCS-26]|uniref:hypothetical protein n=1 Tax=Paraperibacillus marinus TaxID=3115295 RepID=UPI003906A90F
MSEWLTTGQMIDQLNIGQVAKCLTKQPGIHKHVTRTEDDVKWCEADGTLNPDYLFLQMGGGAANFKWRILPKYVSFGEAMEALSKGKLVRAETTQEIFEYKIRDGDFLYRNITRGDDMFTLPARKSGIGINSFAVTEGKWTIEEVRY